MRVVEVVDVLDVAHGEPQLLRCFAPCILKRMLARLQKAAREVEQTLVGCTCANSHENEPVCVGSGRWWCTVLACDFPRM
jgi:hypothetical protein